jgi:hypothetical protein
MSMYSQVKARQSLKHSPLLSPIGDIQKISPLENVCSIQVGASSTHIRHSHVQRCPRAVVACIEMATARFSGESTRGLTMCCLSGFLNKSASSFRHCCAQQRARSHGCTRAALSKGHVISRLHALAGGQWRKMAANQFTFFVRSL